MLVSLSKRMNQCLGCTIPTTGAFLETKQGCTQCNPAPSPVELTELGLVPFGNGKRPKTHRISRESKGLESRRLDVLQTAGAPVDTEQLSPCIPRGSSAGSQAAF